VGTRRLDVDDAAAEGRPGIFTELLL